MSGFKEYPTFDGLGLAELIRKGEVSAEEVCEAAINQIEKVNPKLNAVIYKMYEMGREAAKNPPVGPFSGVPFLIKDLMTPVAGVPLTNGSKSLKDFIPQHDDELVKRYKASGILPLGKTNTPEFGIYAITEPDLHGPTRNPWNPNLTPGGSSGGSSSAVASGMVPIASAGDGGGSIRIPASCTGLFGMKPSRGRQPLGPHKGEAMQGAVVRHVLSRSVRDSAYMLDATEGMDQGARVVALPPHRPYAEEIMKDPKPLRIGLCIDSPVRGPVDPDCREATMEAAKLLESLGHKVEIKTPDIDFFTLGRSIFTLFFSEVAAGIKKYKMAFGKAPRRSFETETYALGLIGKHISAHDLVLATQIWDEAARKMADFHNTYDIYMSPTMASPPVQIGELKMTGLPKFGVDILNAFRITGYVDKLGIANKIAMKTLKKNPFTQLANFTGAPAMSVPLHWTNKNMPIGVHFQAPTGEDGALFSLAAQLERAKPWKDKHPDIF